MAHTLPMSKEPSAKGISLVFVEVGVPIISWHSTAQIHFLWMSQPAFAR